MIDITENLEKFKVRYQQEPVSPDEIDICPKCNGSGLNIRSVLCPKYQGSDHWKKGTDKS